MYWEGPPASATLTSTGCDWSGSLDNTPDDVAGAASWSGGDDATFGCDATGACTP